MMCKLHSRLCLIIVLCLASIPVLGQQETTEQNPKVIVHVVQQGETLFRIAQDYGLTVDDIVGLNGIEDPGDIQIGQRLLIPVDEPVEAEPQVHVVQPGESLVSIARLYELDPAGLAALNEVADPDRIFAGQTLILSDDAPTQSPSALQKVTITHTVARGETLFLIATRYGTTVEALEEANELEDPTLIFAGQEITVPDVQPPQVALDLPSVVSGLDINPVFLVEGRSVRIRLTSHDAASVTGTLLGNDLIAFSEQGNTVHTILFAVPMYTEPGIYPMSLTVAPAGGQAVTISVNVRVVPGGYATQNIVLPQEQAELVSTAVDQNELNMLHNLTSTINPQRHFDGPMSLPAAAAMVEPFGTQRSYNGGPVDRYHSGADFAGLPGSPVYAAAPGQVVLADTLHIRGVALVIDHGWGVYTSYSHMTDRNVGLGDFVATGDVIGTVGSTGRVTGSHLHWEVWLNGVAVDPMQWVTQTFP